MPRETVEINLSSMPVYQAMAIFLSVLAYPMNFEKRDKPWQAICREFILSSNSNPRPLVRRFFLMSELESARVRKSSLALLDKRFVTGFHIGIPLFFQWSEVNDARPTVRSLSYNIADDMRLGGEWPTDANISDIKTRIIKPTRPVFHAATAWARMLLPLIQKDPDFPILDGTYSIMESESEFRKLIELAEHFRLGLAAIKRITIPESETIQFILK